VFVEPLSIAEILLRCGLASLCGFIIGLDREIRDMPAGLRTHMLVCLGAAALAIITSQMYLELRRGGTEDLTADPLRVIEATVAAIGFLGAGAMFRQGGTIAGMTTAANIWLAGVVGLACGAGYFAMASILTAFTVAILTLLYFVKRILGKGD
jgi:putative Mg2+ transporter-C (MgtC) family protein